MSVDILKLGKRKAGDFSPQEVADFQFEGPMSHYYSHPRITTQEVREGMARAEKLANNQRLQALLDTLQLNGSHRN
jgi:hypothetical protein